VRKKSVVVLARRSDSGFERGTGVEPSLADDEIHVWQVDLRAGNVISSGLLEVLSSEETVRAERFHFSRDREAYSICRRALRRILGAYLGARPDKLKFSCGPHGKPQLKEDCSGMPLQFNVSHSRGVGLVAVARVMTVGIDVEYVRPIPDAESIAVAHFSLKEREDLSRLPVSQLDEGFISCWTRKEAYVKALGGGLSVPLNTFCVATQPGAVVDCHGEIENSMEKNPWKVINLRFEEVGSSEIYIGALVAPGPRWHATVRKWQPPRHLLPVSSG